MYTVPTLLWEHTVQRANFATWCTYAMGKGIKMGGRLTWMDIHTKKYGYDYGPEWDDYQNKLMSYLSMKLIM